MKKIEFVSYDGEYPNLCRGNLILKIDGKDVKFGYKSGNDYDQFWESTGQAGVDENLEEYCIGGDWVLDYWDKRIDRDFSKEELNRMIELFNDNVDKPCCGGCI